MEISTSKKICFFSNNQIASSGVLSTAAGTQSVDTHHPTLHRLFEGPTVPPPWGPIILGADNDWHNKEVVRFRLVWMSEVKKKLSLQPVYYGDSQCSNLFITLLYCWNTVLTDTRISIISNCKYLVYFKYFFKKTKSNLWNIFNFLGNKAWPTNCNVLSHWFIAHLL